MVLPAERERVKPLVRRPESPASEAVVDLQLASVLVVGELAADPAVSTTGGILHTVVIFSTNGSCLHSDVVWACNIEWWEVLTFLHIWICCHIRCDGASQDLKIIYHQIRDTGLLFTSTDFLQTRKLIMVKINNGRYHLPHLFIVNSLFENNKKETFQQKT